MRGRPRRRRRGGRARAKEPLALGVDDLQAHQPVIRQAASHLGGEQRVPGDDAGEQRRERGAAGRHAVDGERRLVRRVAVVADRLHCVQHDRSGARRPTRLPSGRDRAARPARRRRSCRPARRGARARARRPRVVSAPSGGRARRQSGRSPSSHRTAAANPRRARARPPRGASRRATPPGFPATGPSAAEAARWSWSSNAERNSQAATVA